MAQDSSYPYYNFDPNAAISDDIFGPQSMSNRGSMRPPPPPSPHLDPHLSQWSPGERQAQGSPYNDLSFSSSPSLEPVPRNLLDPSTGPGDHATGPDPLLRFYNTPGPWDPQRLVGVNSEFRYTTQNNTTTRPSPSFNNFREAPRSDPGSHFTGGHPDSGYRSQSHVTPSVFSDAIQDQSHETRSLAGNIGEMQLRGDFIQQGRPNRDSLGSQPLGFNPEPTEPPELTGLTSLKCTHANCNTTSKNQSEFKKHLQRHVKPFTCDEPNCTRHDGFTTRNDLERHKKAVHNILPDNANDRSFKCAGGNCPKKEKVWPRVDNFRSHCKRMHPMEDLKELVKKSEIEPHKDLVSNLTGAGQYQSPRNPGSDGGSSSSRLRSQQHLQEEPKSKPSAPELFKKTPSDTPALERGHHSDGKARSRGDQFQNQPRDHHAPWQTSLRHNRDSNEDPLVSNFQANKSTPRTSKGGRAATEPWQQSSTSDNQPAFGINVSNSRAEEISKAIADCVTNSIDLSQSSPEEIEHMQHIIRTQLMGVFHPPNPRKRTIEEASTDDSAQPKAKRVACRTCNKTMDRPCDLKKHEKRHSRPWGCTYTSCNKTFGSKNDWKRHENSQHYQLETWRCQEASSTSKINQCAKLFYRRDPFQAHLRKDHAIKEEDYIRDQCRRGRIGRNGQSGFWCGFCKNIVKLVARGLEAWDERFNHIDEMHFKKGQRIDEWYPLDRDIPKGLLRSENVLNSGGMNMDNSDSDDSDGAGRNRSGGRRSPVRPPSPPPPEVPPFAHQEFPPPSVAQGSLPRAMRQAPPAGEPRRKLKSNRYSWFCCVCSDGPYNPALVANCVTNSCNHMMCSSCHRIEAGWQ